MCALAIQGAAVAEATAEYQLRLSAFRFRIFFLRSFRHPCQSGACECFHRHWPAAASPGAPHEIGGDGSSEWRAMASGTKMRRENEIAW